MTGPRLAVHHITFDCAHPVELGRFWADALGWEFDPESDDEEALVSDPSGASPGILFIAVPEPKTAKNRVHLDLRPAGTLRDEEVTRILGLGATLVDDRRDPDGTGWAVLADPEGNELCIVRSLSERS